MSTRSARAPDGGAICAPLAVVVLAIVGLIPILIMIMTAFKTRADVVAVPPKLFFQPSLEGFVFLLTERAVVSKGRMEEFKKAAEFRRNGLV